MTAVIRKRRQTVHINGVDYLVVWSGADELIGPRDTKTSPLWQSDPPPKTKFKPAVYCGVSLVGGWCKRAVGHDGDCACS